MLEGGDATGFSNPDAPPASEFITPQRRFDVVVTRDATSALHHLEPGSSLYRTAYPFSWRITTGDVTEARETGVFRSKVEEAASETPAGDN